MKNLRIPFTAILPACGAAIATSASAATGDLPHLAWAPDGPGGIPGFAPAQQDLETPPPAWALVKSRATLGSSWAWMASAARATPGWSAWMMSVPASPIAWTSAPGISTGTPETASLDLTAQANDPGPRE